MTSEHDNAVEEHRKMVLMSGKISEFQLENLKKWPFITFGRNLDKIEIEYDFTTSKDEKSESMEVCAGYVTYNFHFNENFNMSRDDILARLSSLTVWVKYLFWKDTEVKFKKEGKSWEI